MKKLLFICSLLTTWLLVGNSYAQTVEEIEFTITHKEVVGASGSRPWLELSGKHDTYGKITICLEPFNGTYKTYDVYYAILGKLSLTGSAKWSKEGNVEILDANLSTAKFDKEPTAEDQVFHIIGTYKQEETVTLDFLGFSTFGYDPNYKDWFMRMEGTDPSRPEYGYKVELAYYAPANNGFGTFTTANDDINMADSYVHTPTGDLMLDSITLTVEKKKVSDNLTQTTANAKMFGKNGVTYLVTCTHNSITPTEQFQATLDCATLTRKADSFTFAADCQNYSVSLVVNSKVLIGKFPMKSIDVAQSYIHYNGNELNILSIQAEVKTQTVANNLACVAQVALLTQDTVQYVLSMVHVLPAPTEHIDVTATNLIVSDVLSEELGVVNFDAKNDRFFISGAWKATEATEGTYTQSDLTIELQDLQSDLTIYALDATLNVKLDAFRRWMITGTVRGDDNVLYNLHLTYVVPTPKDTVVVRFDHSSRAIFTPDMDNDLLFENEDEHYYASINVRNIAMESTFSIMDVDREFCGVKDSLTGVYTELADINGRIFQLGDTTIMQAQLISMDATLYDIELWYVVPTPIDTVMLSFPVEFGDLRNEEGYYQLYGPSSDTTYIVAFSPLSEDIEGTFVYDGMFGKFGAEGGRMEMDYRNTYIVTMEDNLVTSMMPLEKGQMTVTMDKDGNITAVAEAICSDKIFYHITMTAKYEREYLRGDKQTGAVDKTYTAADKLDTLDYSNEGYVYLTITAADGSDMVAMHIFVDSTDADILIPEGVYPINKSYRPGTVLGNMGPNDNNQLTTPFYATTSSKGLKDVYMWVKGTVTVAKKEGKLYLEVNALNSYDVPVHIIYDATLTDVKNIHILHDKVSKYFQNGQLIIRKDGVKYNVQGEKL